jgi:hypothetical protein
MFQPRFAPAVTTLTSSTVFCPMSLANMRPVVRSQAKLCEFRIPYA